MPIIAIAGIAAGASAIAAGGLTVMGTIGAIGGIVGGIGALTGNKTMMKVGMVAGLAGGIGAFAESSGWTSSGSTGDGFTSGGSAASNLPDNIDAGGGWNPGSASYGESSGADFGNVASGLSQASDYAGETSGLMSASNPTDYRLSMGTQSSPLVDEAANASGLSNPSGLNPTDKRLMAGTQTSPLAAEKTGALDMLGKFGASIKGMDKDTKSILANFIGGAFDSKKKAEAEWLKTRMGIEKQKMANASAVPKFDFHLEPRAPLGLFNAGKLA